MKFVIELRILKNISQTQCFSLCVPVVLCRRVFAGKDVATNVEVYWPDGRSVARPLEPTDINSVLEIRYPKDEDEVTPTAEIEVHERVILECSFLGNPSGISQH